MARPKKQATKKQDDALAKSATNEKETPIKPDVTNSSPEEQDEAITSQDGAEVTSEEQDAEALLGALFNEQPEVPEQESSTDSQLVAEATSYLVQCNDDTALAARVPRHGASTLKGLIELYPIACKIPVCVEACTSHYAAMAEIAFPESFAEEEKRRVIHSVKWATGFHINEKQAEDPADELTIIFSGVERNSVSARKLINAVQKGLLSRALTGY